MSCLVLQVSTAEERKQMNDKGLSDMDFGYLPNDVHLQERVIGTIDVCSLAVRVKGRGGKELLHRGADVWVPWTCAHSPQIPPTVVPEAEKMAAGPWRGEASGGSGSREGWCSTSACL